MSEPNLRERYEEFKRMGYLRIERSMAMLWELSSPWSPPDSGGGTALGDQNVGQFAALGLLAWRTVGDRDRVFQGFLMETPAGREFERAFPDRDGDGDYDLSSFFWYVTGVHRSAYVDNPGFSPHWHRQQTSPLDILRRCGFVRKNPDGEFQWLEADGSFRPFPEVEALAYRGSSAGRPA